VAAPSSIQTGDATDAIKQGGEMQKMAVDFAREAGKFCTHQCHMYSLATHHSLACLLLC
jgi:hypothetical protein